MSDPKSQVLERAEQNNIKYIDLQFTDVVGVVKNVTIPTRELPKALEEGIWFDGSAIEGFARVAESDMHLRPDELVARVATSAAVPYEGLYQSRGGLRLPDLGRFDDEIAPFTQTSRVRVWYGATDRWRTDELLIGAERSAYREPGGIWLWDSGTRRVIFSPREGDEPLRIPRLMDLNPAELAGRLLRESQGDTIERIDDRWVAGHASAGLRIVPEPGTSTIESVELWIDADRGVVTAIEIETGGAAPSFETAFADLSFRTPELDVMQFDPEPSGEPVRTSATVDPIEALAGLGAERIDLMQLHNLRGADSLFGPLRELKAAGRIGYIVITSSSDGQYAEMEAIMRREALDFIQVDYAVGNRGAGERLLPLAADRGAAVLANLPFGRGAQFRAVGDRPLPGWAAEIGCRSWAQVFLKYVVSHPAVTCAIPGTTRVEHIEDNLDSARGRLPDAALRRTMEKFFDGIADA